MGAQVNYISYNFVHNLVLMPTAFLRILAAPTCKQVSGNNSVQELAMITNKQSYDSPELELFADVSHVIKKHVQMQG